jgi:integrase/recombinase XerD
MRRIKKFPVIPSREDVLKLLNSTENLKHKAILFLIYGSGLRVSEVAKLKISDFKKPLRWGGGNYVPNQS